MLRVLPAVIALVIAMTPSLAQAYVGPGAGVTAIGAALGLIAAIGLAFWALISYPLRRARKKKKEEAAAQQNSADQSAAE